MTVDRNGFTKPRCSELRTGITKKCASARFYEMPHGFVKSIPITYEEGIDRRVFSGFEQNRFLHQTAKRMRPEDVAADLAELKRKGYLQDR